MRLFFQRLTRGYRLTLFEPKVSRVYTGERKKRIFKDSRATAGCRRDVDESAMSFPLGENLRRPCTNTRRVSMSQLKSAWKPARDIQHLVEQRGKRGLFSHYENARSFVLLSRVHVSIVYPCNPVEGFTEEWPSCRIWCFVVDSTKRNRGFLVERTETWEISNCELR